MNFDPQTLGALRDAVEVGITTARNAAKPVIIWVVAVDDAVFVRSVQGPKGRWYRSAAADGSATLELGDRRIPVRAIPVADAATIERVSQTYLAKYATSSYAPAMVRAEVLPTTLRLEPR